ncbi:MULTISPECIES: alpha-1,2-mannosidase [Streptomyces]|uniref:alpha-1,2-mannosidase n=1 Tax=Streptomyces TaxID=1883 RepID=UPI0029A5097C|nr:alpha-1,2-mannosidase [Streptomyces sp. ND04-05B]MDX3062787.1 alpha-1,2-mannosidase [Streptomyces sp. ND04-05B]
MQPTFADFSATPVSVSNAGIRYRDCHEAPSHLVMGADASTELDFEVDGAEQILEATLKVTALVSKLGGSPGHAPVDLLLNGKVLTEGLTVPGGGDLPQDNVFAVPGELLRPGTNTLEIRTGADARSMLWLYRVTLDSVYERGRSERAMAAAAARDTVFTYTTERRLPFTSDWRPGPRLLFHVDRGEQSLPAQLGWRGQNGAESAISFQSNMSDFHGHHRAADGTLAEFRGRVIGRGAFPEGTEGVRVHRFRTEEGWGGGWHDSGELRILVEDGSGPVERVTWRDQRGNSGVAGLSIATGRSGAGDAPDVTAGATVVDVSDEFEEAGEVATNLLRDSRAKWLAGSCEATVDFAFGRPLALTGYTLTTANDFPDRDPRDWTLLGSQDGIRWTELDSRAGESFTGRFESRRFRIGAAPVAYSRYRLDITGNGGAGEIQLSGVRFAGVASDHFSGYYQRHDEGPIGYRGTALATPDDAAERERTARLAVELEQAARSLAEAARSIGRLADSVRDR